MTYEMLIVYDISVFPKKKSAVISVFREKKVLLFQISEKDVHWIENIFKVYNQNNEFILLKQKTVFFSLKKKVYDNFSGFFWLKKQWTMTGEEIWISSA